MKENIQIILNEYLKVFPDEEEKLFLLNRYLKQSIVEEITDWNNQNGHITIGAFVYSQREDKFLVLYHKDLEMYLYPGGHLEKKDKTLISAAKRELKEETGLENLELLKISNKGIPFDIDIHLIPQNKRVGMPKHYHFDFRYLFLVKDISEINFDKEEFKDYKWILSKELSKDKNYGDVINKLNKLLI